MILCLMYYVVKKIKITKKIFKLLLYLLKNKTCMYRKTKAKCIFNDRYNQGLKIETNRKKFRKENNQ
jgi:hypothetical protein